MTDKTVLVTGSTGWIGRYCCDILRAKGYQVFPYLGDLLHPTEYMPDATHLLHLAWITKPGEYWESPLNRDWFESSLRLFQKFDGDRIVVAGSCAEITDTLYGRSKNALRKVLEAYSDILGVSSAWGKIYYLYGPYEKPDRLISSTIISLLKGKEVVIDKPSQMVDFFHVEDVAGSLCAILDSDAKDTVEIGSGQAITIMRVVQIISEQIGRPDLVRFNHVAEPMHVKCNPTRLKYEIGYIPKFDIIGGLANTVEWWMRNLNQKSIQEGDTE
jgi:nucleoside-diphosphate-sugar epimerase